MRIGPAAATSSLPRTQALRSRLLGREPAVLRDNGSVVGASHSVEWRTRKGKPSAPVVIKRMAAARRCQEAWRLLALAVLLLAAVEPASAQTEGSGAPSPRVDPACLAALGLQARLSQ